MLTFEVTSFDIDCNYILKIPRTKGIITIKADQLDALACANTSLSYVGCFSDTAAQDQAAKTQDGSVPCKTSASKPPINITPRASGGTTTSKGVNTSSFSTRLLAEQEMDNKKKGTTKDEELALVNFLLENLSVFAWKISDMPGIPREVNEHKLEIDPSIKPIMQKEKRYTPEKRGSIWQEVNHLLEARFIRQVDYLSWLANSVLVEKLDGS
jgi:hypothetical protein